MNIRPIGTILLLMFLFWGNMLYAQSQMLVVWHKNGQKIYYDLAENPKTTFSGTEIVITTNDISISYPLEQVLRYTYELQTSDIDNIDRPKPTRVSQNGNRLVFENLEAGTEIQLFSTDGKLLAAQTANGSHAVTVSLASYPPGVYVVKANGATYKMMKR